MVGLFANKRAVSPLVATFLLILLSIGLGAAVMSWGEQYIEAKAEFVQGVQETVTSCDLVSFSVITIGGVRQLCTDKKSLKGFVDNGADANIADFHARIIGKDGVFVQESVLDRPLPRGSAVPFTFSTGEIGDVQQVKLTPKIAVGGKQVTCAKQSVLLENIPQC